MANFLTIEIIVKELLSRIQRLEAQVTICIQSQEVLFQQASNCQLAQECLKLAKDFGDGDDEQLSKGIDHTHIGTTNGKKCPSPCPNRASTTRNARQNCNSSPPPRPQDVTPHSPTFAQIPNTQALGMEPEPRDEVMAPDEIREFLRQIESIMSHDEPEPTSTSVHVGPQLKTSAVDGRQRQRQRQRHQRKKILQSQVCHKCGKTFSTTGHLLRHFLEVHRRVRAVQSTCANRFQCEFCGASYGKRNSLRVHQSRAHGHFSKGVPRDIRMEGDSDSTAEATRVGGDQPFVCQICGKSFRYQGKLEYHIYMHTHQQKLRRKGSSSPYNSDVLTADEFVN